MMVITLFPFESFRWCSENPPTLIPVGGTIPPVADIIHATIQGRRERGPPDSQYVDLPFPLADQWKAAKSLHHDPQVVKVPEYLGIPNRQQTRALLLAKFKEMNLSEK